MVRTRVMLARGDRTPGGECQREQFVERSIHTTPEPMEALFLVCREDTIAEGFELVAVSKVSIVSPGR
jgi:hypothetical protein